MGLSWLSLKGGFLWAVLAVHGQVTKLLAASAAFAGFVFLGTVGLASGIRS